MPGDIFRQQGRWRAVITDSQIRFITGLQAAKFGVEVAAQQGVAVRERPGKAVRPERSACIAMFEKGKFHLFKHVGTDAIGAERQIAHPGELVVVTHMVVHIGAGVMHQETVFFIQQVNVAGR